MWGSIWGAGGVMMMVKIGGWRCGDGSVMVRVQQGLSIMAMWDATTRHHMSTA
jgi:hypothetical protein